MLDILFFGTLIVYFLAVVAHFLALAFRKEQIIRAAWAVFYAGFALNTVFIIARGVTAGRLPLSNQFEFATAFAWCIALMAIVLHRGVREPWIGALTSAAAFLILSFAALQPRKISELMPALRSAWFGFHIGSAVFSYSAFMIAACISLRYLLLQKSATEEEERLSSLDYLSYRLTAFGFLMLTLTILSGCIWAEQAWSAFWTWDPKETWALITWLIYAAYLHLRLQKKWRGKRMAVFSLIGIVCVLFTFIGVNVLFTGLHSYK
ncbi:MAG: c-type cytochrome biogenesis protein CcsB [Oscillospiraceae bacterium]|nr:c-type cytochrome biogenesis protein CcsB [Oscillospiraceae bacterium]